MKLIALYAEPEDREAFLDHYNTVHMPLVARIPGLLESTVTLIDSALIGEGAPFMITEMRFADAEAFAAAMASPENRAAGKDLMGFARGRVTLVQAHTVC